MHSLDDVISGSLIFGTLCLMIQGLLIWGWFAESLLRDYPKAMFITNAVFFSLICLALVLHIAYEHRSEYFVINMLVLLLCLALSFWISSLFYRGWKQNKNYFNWKNWEGGVLMVLVILFLLVPFYLSRGYRAIII